MSNLSLIKGDFDPTEKERIYQLMRSIVDRVKSLESEISWIERDVKKTKNENLQEAFNVFRLNMVQVLKISIDSYKLLELENMNKIRKDKCAFLKLVNDDINNDINNADDINK